MNQEVPRTPEDAHHVQPRVYVASLSDYNSGRLYGTWLAADVEADDLHAATQAMLGASQEPHAEAWAIHDYEGFGPLRLSEFESLERVTAIARAISEHGLSFARWIDYRGSFEPDDEGLFDEAYLGTFDSPVEFAEHLLDDLGIERELDQALAFLPESYRAYVRFDVESFAHDLEIELYMVEHEGGMDVFDPRV